MRYRRVCCTGIWVVRLPGHMCRVCFSARLLGFTYYKKKSSIDHEVIENLNLPFAAFINQQFSKPLPATPNSCGVIATFAVSARLLGFT